MHPPNHDKRASMRGAERAHTSDCTLRRASMTQVISFRKKAATDLSCSLGDVASLLNSHTSRAAVAVAAASHVSEVRMAGLPGGLPAAAASNGDMTAPSAVRGAELYNTLIMLTPRQLSKCCRSRSLVPSQNGNISWASQSLKQSLELATSTLLELPTGNRI